MKSENELKVNDELIARYLSGDASPEEAMAVHDWISVPENKAQFDELESTWNASYPSRKVRAVNAVAAWEKLDSKITKGRGRQVFMGLSGKALGIAATIAIVAVSAVIILFMREPAAHFTYNTGDTTQLVTFADNSNVTLYRNSSLEYSADFNKKSREVKLASGEAFFSVAKDESKPFIVHASFADVRVVGTEFNVVIKDGRVEVGVNEGKVLVTTATDSIYVTKGSTAILEAGQAPATQDIDANKWAYATKRLVFKDTPVKDVISAIEKTYNCRILVSNDNIKNCVLTGTFEGNSIDNIVALMTQTLSLTFEQNGQVFNLEGEGCH